MYCSKCKNEILTKRSWVNYWGENRPFFNPTFSLIFKKAFLLQGRPEEGYQIDFSEHSEMQISDTVHISIQYKCSISVHYISVENWDTGCMFVRQQRLVKGKKSLSRKCPSKLMYWAVSQKESFLKDNL